MKVLVATDAWHPQVNGVVCTYDRLAKEVAKRGDELHFLTPQDFRTVPCPTYPEIRLALAWPRKVARRIEEIAPDFIHIATEGPVGLMTRRYCITRKRPFTTSYHTRFPEYVSARLPVPLRLGYAVERWFHNRAAGTFVATQSMAEQLKREGIERIMPWSRGVDTEHYRPRPSRLFGDGPVFLYVGRIAVEKNIEAFLSLDLPGKKVLTGGGPQAAMLEKKYPDAIFTGPKHGEELAEIYASADVFVFPSLTDTFGLVLLEAMASGVPVAAYPVCGPKDVVTDPAAGVLSEDLRDAALKALELDGSAARAHALKFSWEVSADQFLENVLAANDVRPRRRTFTRWRNANRPQIEGRPGWGETGRLALMRLLGDAWGIVRPNSNGNQPRGNQEFPQASRPKKS
ncbi:GDP-mannose-dependent alpha-mannosyltransferase [Methyloligella halotolerans]|uniref:GDP-mannose-dependent alpha-mannosyltransferase n=1 Tax=Methyloligella halotolerans TaxID=1177755 RepID=A0A1E2S3L7_9HYPH|nr:glycosyltransferase family 1 protein [Methyloligella halotolerans]ODA68918.1 GDP-mannose-dependent alpha-mannosyltransferase [Methyloligella halotolerans]